MLAGLMREIPVRPHPYPYFSSLLITLVPVQRKHSLKMLPQVWHVPACPLVLGSCINLTGFGWKLISAYHSPLASQMALEKAFKLAWALISYRTTFPRRGLEYVIQSFNKNPLISGEIDFIFHRKTSKIYYMGRILKLIDS
jgi:hypothetical protein